MDSMKEDGGSVGTPEKNIPWGASGVVQWGEGGFLQHPRLC